MKASSATSGEANAAASATPTAGPPSASSPTPIADAPVGGFPLSGPSDLPNPRTHAFRKDLADVSLAGRVIASHYAVPLPVRLIRAAVLTTEPTEEAQRVAELTPGTEVRILDKGRGWAWGYAGDQVGYLPSAALGKA